MKLSLVPLNKVKMKPKPGLKVTYEVLSLAFPKSIFRAVWEVENPKVYSEPSTSGSPTSELLTFEPLIKGLTARSIQFNESLTWLKARIPLSIRSLSTGV
jgi:hypothetical protein